jgi:hypothetical protein
MRIQPGTPRLLATVGLAILLGQASAVAQWPGSPQVDRPDVVFAMEFWPAWFGAPWQVTIRRDGVVEQQFIGELEPAVELGVLTRRELARLLQSVEGSGFQRWPAQEPPALEDVSSHVLAAEVAGHEHRIVVQDACYASAPEGFRELWAEVLDMIGPLRRPKLAALYFDSGRCEDLAAPSNKRLQRTESSADASAPGR